MSNHTDAATDAAVDVLARELEVHVKKKRKKRSIFVRSGFNGKNVWKLSTLLCELASVDHSEYERHIRMNVEKFEEQSIHFFDNLNNFL